MAQTVLGAIEEISGAVNRFRRTLNAMIAHLLIRKLAFPAALAAATSAVAQETPEDLGRLWAAAIAHHSAAEARALIHPNCPEGSIPPQLLERLVDGPLPPHYSIVTQNLGRPSDLAAIYRVIPEKQLTLKYETATPDERRRFGLGKGFPIARADGRWFFVVCLK